MMLKSWRELGTALSTALIVCLLVVTPLYIKLNHQTLDITTRIRDAQIENRIILCALAADAGIDSRINDICKEASP